MSDEIICTDAEFDAYQWENFIKYKVTPPELNKLYSIREVKKHHNGETGILLNELKNPKVPFISFTGIEMEMETSWNIRRFRTLQGNPILTEKEDILETIDNYTTI